MEAALPMNPKRRRGRYAGTDDAGVLHVVNRHGVSHCRTSKAPPALPRNKTGKALTCLQCIGALL